MSKTGVKAIAIAYAIALMFTYVMRHPPGWMTSVAVTAGGSHSIELLGHRIEVSVDVTRSVPASPPLSSPLRRVWLETPVTISCVSLQPGNPGPFPEHFTYHADVEDTGGSTAVDGR